MGSVCDEKTESKRSVLTEEKVLDIQTQSEISPRKSLRCLAQESDVLLVLAFTGTRLIHFHPYKITVMHDLKQPDYAARIHFCNQLLQIAHDGLTDPQMLFIPD
jgi:hypothetical protein